MKTTNVRVTAAAVAAVAWAMAGAASCAKGATETDPLSGSTSVGVGGGDTGTGGSGAGGASSAAGGGMKMPCTKASQCPTNFCQAGVCAEKTCANGKQDGTETDTDCGGPSCGPCQLGKTCKDPTDCTSGICNGDTCAAFDCMDGKKNGSESDVDCGGTNCPSCGPGQACTSALDCGGAPCTSGKCKFEITFTTCGQTGATGPTQGQCDAAYGTGNALKGKVTVTNGYQAFTIPSDGNYQIEAYGAEGGTVKVDAVDKVLGGAGAKIRGDFMLKKGDVLKIVVGQRGSDATSMALIQNVGGGGGTFVAVNADKPLIVAGGGGGFGAYPVNNPDKTLVGGKAKQGDGTGGKSSGLGNYNGCGGDGSGGGGFTTDGNGGGGQSFLNGAVGCTSKRPGQCGAAGIGGFGGGGNGGNGGPGGGGYQGGDAGCDLIGSPIGRGGFSYNAGSNPSNTDATNTGPGKVIIRSL